ncbi:MAG TPA: hypothetical protein VM597_33340, partial [Gemmataceae bacterium]|nr:hypothetical protein [Gemmataceae bacterium]
VVTPIAGAIDLLPTIADLAGVKRVGDKPLDGVNFATLLRGGRAETPERVLFQHWAGRVSARSQTHRLDADGKLFDMVADPGQSTDVAVTQPAVAAKLKAAVVDWRKDVLAGIARKDDRPFPVGYKRSPVTQLPARDGVAHGTIQRSARAPNCSYFTNWTRAEDRITWDVEVDAGGRYRVEVLYTCAKENVGATIELSFRDARLSAKVTESHDPPATGAAHDRAPRTAESLVKDFKPWALGTIDLPRGRGLLTLKAPEIPGKEAIDVRSLLLTLVD